MRILTCCFCFLQVTLGIITTGRGIPWNRIVSEWLTTCCWTMDCTGKWRSMCVSEKLPYKAIIGLDYCWSLYFFSLSVLHFRGHTRRRPRRWRSTTVTTTSSSCGPYGQTTCLSSASRCSAVSRVFGANEPSVPKYLWKISFPSSYMIINEPWTTHTAYLLQCCQSCGVVWINYFCFRTHQMVNPVSQCLFVFNPPFSQGNK